MTDVQNSSILACGMAGETSNWYAQRRERSALSALASVSRRLTYEKAAAAAILKLSERNGRRAAYRNWLLKASGRRSLSYRKRGMEESAAGDMQRIGGGLAAVYQSLRIFSELMAGRKTQDGRAARRSCFHRTMAACLPRTTLLACGNAAARCCRAGSLAWRLSTTR